MSVERRIAVGVANFHIVAVPVVLPGGKHRAVSKGTDCRAGIGREVCAVVEFHLVFQWMQPVAETGRGIACDRRRMRKRQLVDSIADIGRHCVAGIDCLLVEKRLARSEGSLQLRALRRLGRRRRCGLRGRFRRGCWRRLRRGCRPGGHVHIHGRQILPQLFVLRLHRCGRKHAADLGKDGFIVIVRIDGRQQHLTRVRCRRRGDHLHRRQQQEHRRAQINFPAFHAHHPR